MTEYQPQDLSEIESLLATRQKLTEWLEKLDVAGSKTPAAVRSKVRSDYQGRLNGVVEQLRDHSDVISTTVKELRVYAEDRDRTRAELQDTLSEAELRHAVGEFSDEEWKVVERESTRKLTVLHQELDRYNKEIKRLDEVLSQILPAGNGDKRRERPVEISAGRPADLALVRDETPQPIAATATIQPASIPMLEPPEAPRFTPKPGNFRGREPGPARAIPFPVPSSVPEVAKPAPSADEITFLKSMTLDPARATGTANSTVTPSVPEVKTPERASPAVAKTLKCGECGALNRPTEWYCERCGAELAAV